MRKNHKKQIEGISENKPLMDFMIDLNVQTM